MTERVPTKVLPKRERAMLSAPLKLELYGCIVDEDGYRSMPRFIAEVTRKELDNLGIPGPIAWGHVHPLTKLDEQGS